MIMAKFVIHGGRKLNGTITPSGAKNAALKMMAASILTEEKVILENVPRISDLDLMIDILKSIGSNTSWTGKNQITIINNNLTNFYPAPELVKKMRASIVLAGPLLARFGKAKIAKPGGCVIGARPVYEHWNALKKFGVNVRESDEYSLLTIKKNHLIGTKIILDAMSVTATENVLMAAVLAKGKTQIRLAACEPEIQDLVKMLNQMGAKISGEKTHAIEISGVTTLHGTRHRIIFDRIEAMTFAIAAIVTGGKVIIKNIIPDYLDIILNRFDQAGINYKFIKDDLTIAPPHKFHPIKIDTRPYPGYPTDLQAPTSILMTQLPRTSKIFETIFDNRLKYLLELEKMGAKVKILDSHTAEITGPTKLHGARITSFDLRAGATLIIAGLIAKGKTEISNIETIDRGYEDIEGKLKKIGANIQRVE